MVIPMTTKRKDVILTTVRRKYLRMYFVQYLSLSFEMTSMYSERRSPEKSHAKRYCLLQYVVILNGT